jgi:hypothetical protein
VAPCAHHAFTSRMHLVGTGAHPTVLEVNLKG